MSIKKDTNQNFWSGHLQAIKSSPIHITIKNNVAIIGCRTTLGNNYSIYSKAIKFLENDKSFNEGNSCQNQPGKSEMLELPGELTLKECPVLYFKDIEIYFTTVN